MTFKTSSDKINPAWNLYGFSLKKNIGITLIFGIIAAIVCPVFGIISIVQNKIGNPTFFKQLFDYTGDGISAENAFAATSNDIDMTVYGPTVFVICFLLAIICAFVLIITNFHFLYSRQSGDLFHALPLKRNEMLLARFGSVVTCSLAITVIPYFSLTVFSLLTNVKGLDTAVIWKTFPLTSISVILFSSMLLFFTVCAGGIFDMIVAVVVYSAGIFAIGLFGGIVYTSNIIGGTDLSIGEILGYVVRAIPEADGIVQIFRLSDYTAAEYILDTVIYTAVSALLIYVSIVLFNKRKSEKTGEGYVFTLMKVIITVLGAVISGIVCGAIFSVADNTAYGIFFWCFGLIGALIGGVGIYAVINRSFKGFWKGLIGGIISFAIIFAVFISAEKVGIKETVYLPEEKDIASVSLSLSYDEGLPCKDKAKVLLFHSKITDYIKENDYNVDIIGKEKKSQTNNEDSISVYSEIYNSSTSNCVTFNYKLSDGSEFEREYRIDIGFETELFAEITVNRDYESIYPRLEYTKDVWIYDCKTGDSMDISGDVLEKIIETSIEEWKECNYDVNPESIITIQFDYTDYDNDGILFDNFRSSIIYSEDFTQTTALLNAIKTKYESENSTRG